MWKTKIETKNKDNKWKTVTYMVYIDINLIIPIISLNVNGLNIQVKRQRLSEWIGKKKKDQTVCCLQETHFKYKDYIWIKSKGMEKDIPC